MKLPQTRILGHLRSLVSGIYPGIIPETKERICAKDATQILTKIGERSLSLSQALFVGDAFSVIAFHLIH